MTRKEEKKEPPQWELPKEQAPTTEDLAEEEAADALVGGEMSDTARAGQEREQKEKGDIAIELYRAVVEMKLKIESMDIGAPLTREEGMEVGNKRIERMRKNQNDACVALSKLWIDLGDLASEHGKSDDEIRDSIKGI